MVNAMLLRIHQSGHLAKLDAGRGALVKEALDVYKSIRADIKEAVPFWPLGLSQFSDEWVALGLRTEKNAYVAVWRREGSNSCCELPLPAFRGMEKTVTCIYPSCSESRFEWQSGSGKLSVCLEHEKTARLFKLV